MKKTAISSSTLYKLEPALGVECCDHILFAQDAAAALLNQSMFLRDSLDENVHPFLVLLPNLTKKYRVKHEISPTLL